MLGGPSLFLLLFFPAPGSLLDLGKIPGSGLQHQGVERFYILYRADPFPPPDHMVELVDTAVLGHLPWGHCRDAEQSWHGGIQDFWVLTEVDSDYSFQ